MVKSDQMTGYQETPGVFSTGTGSFIADIDDDAQTITFELRYTGLSAPALVSHIHFGTASMPAASRCSSVGAAADPRARRERRTKR